jgi:hypothetical protein
MALTSYQFAVTSGGTSNTKGSYTQFVASTPYASSRLHVSLVNSTVVSHFVLLDIATGGAGVETVVVANLACYANSSAMFGSGVSLELDLPAGTRIALRTQASATSAVSNIQLWLEDRALASLASPVTYGANTATSRGTLVDPGLVANTKGSYVQLTASTSARIDVLLLAITGNGNGATFVNGLVDLATGAAAAETVVIPDVMYVSNTGGTALLPEPLLLVLPVSIPAGTRLAARAASSITTAARMLAISLIGMQQPATSGGGSAGAVAYVG